MTSIAHPLQCRHTRMDAPKPATTAKRPLLTEEWDDPAMIELMRQQSEDRVEFAGSDEAANWLELMQTNEPASWTPRLAAALPSQTSERTVILPW